MLDKDNLSRRDFLKGTGGVAGASVLAGCDGGGSGDSTPAESTDTTSGSDGGDAGTTLNMINTGTMTSLDPVAISDTASGIVANQCYEGLMTYPNANPEVEQNLATGYETSDDFLEYTFTLQEGVQYHNDMGELTASDVVYSWERLAASPASERAYFILDSMGIEAQNQNGEAYATGDEYQPGSMQVEATGDYEVSFTLRRPFHATMQMLAYGNFAIHPEGIVGDIEGYDGEVDQETIATSASYGTGPFVLDFWEQGDSAQVTAFEDFRRDDQPKLDAINWAIIEKPEPQYRYATNGNADLLKIPTQYYDPGKVSVEETTEAGQEMGTYGPISSGSLNGTTVNYLRTPEIGTYYIAFDVSNTEPAVRKAVAYMVNREEIANSTFKKRQPVAYHLTPPAIYPGGAEAYDQHVEENYPYGLAESQIENAKQVMEEAGYGPDNQYELTINSYQGIFTEMVRGLRDKLSAAHINASVEPTDFATIIEKGKKGNLQCYTLGWIADWPAPDNFVQLMAPEYTDVAELGQSALTYTNWSEIDTDAKTQAQEAWDTISNNLDPSDEATQTRAEAYVQLEEANWEDVVLINIVHGATERFYGDNVSVEPFGGMGISRQTHYTTTKE
ncbi:ABC transporter substrate-binding protein [Halobacteria archaeon HArc-gm2]|nr:ABC transporter substrate-binding protein [Halobacteria archaeon HArc-gm2]